MQSKFKKNFIKGHTLDIFHVILGYPDTKQLLSFSQYIDFIKFKNLD